MQIPASLQRRIHWINLPGAILMLLLQRLPAVSSVVAAEEILVASPVGTVLKATVAAVAALGAVNTMAGATPLSPSSGTASGVTVAAGSSVLVFYTVNGTDTPPQSWSVSGSIPPGLNFSGLTDSGGGVNTSTLQLSGTPTTGGSYHVTIQAFEFSDQGGIESPAYNYTITVTGSTNVAPSFTSQPSGATVTEGASVTFTASASGSPNPSYQWQKNSGDIGGATGSSYTIASTTVGDSGSYTVVASNAAGSVTSNAATLTVNPATSPPAITQQPQSQTVTAGNPVTFFAAASGNPAPGYQWQKNGGDIGGATGSSYTIGNVSPGDAGSYTVTASNVAGSAVSSAASLTVNVFPAITQQPQSQTVLAGSSVTFTGAASGTPAPSLQWRKNNVDIPGATGGSLTLNNVQLADTGSYALAALNAAGLVVSSAATLTVNAAPAITGQPASATAFLGGAPATFSVTVTGSPAPTYQWQRLPAGSGTWGDLGNGGAYSGVTTTTVTITGPTLAMSGDQFRCIATNIAGTATSSAATLTVVVPLPVITTQPAGQTVVLGAVVNLSVVAGSPVTLSYQWSKDGSGIPGATSASYNIASAQLTDAGSYTVVVTNSAGSVTSAAAAVAVASGPPVITGQPSPLTITGGDPFTFSVTATSNVPLTYQWKQGGTPIAGATQNSYTKTDAQLADAGSYIVDVTNVAGTVTSTAVTLTVLGGPPVITTQPLSKAVFVSVPTTFSVVATGLPSPTYQWQRLPAGSGTWGNLSDGGAYSGSTTATLSLSAATLVMNGDQFRCIVTNALGSATSAAASLAVAVPGFPKISAGRYHSLRLDAADQLNVTGTNTYGQLGTGNTTTITTPQVVSLPGQTVADLAAGGQHSLFLTAAGELWVTGINDNGELGDGTVVAKSTPFKLTGGVAGMAAAVFHSAYLKSDGTLWTVGGNDSGQLGNGTTTDSSTPIQIASGVIDVALGNHQTLFLKSDGTLWGMGDLSNTGPTYSTPIQIAGNVTTVSAGAFHTLFLKTDGSLWTVGFNAYGQLGNGTTASTTTPVQVATGVKAIAAGYFHSAFIKTDNTLWVMGYNSGGQLGDGTNNNHATPFQLATNVAAVSASEAYTLFTKLDGTLWGTGYNAYGQFGNGTATTTTAPVQIGAGTVPAPLTPTGLASSTVAAQDRVHLAWSPAPDARSYQVWRNTVNNPATATELATAQRWPVYEDLTAQSGQGYYYWVAAVNPAGTSAFSTPVIGATSTATAPTITTDPQTQTVNVGDTVNFSVTVTGDTPFVYQWRKGGSNLTDAGTLSGSATGTLTVTGAQTVDAGSYDVVVTNSAGSATSNPATLTVNLLAQTITFGPLSGTAYTPVPLALSATASSALPVTFSVISGPASLNGSNLTLTGVGAVIVRASQAGNATYAAASTVDQSFNVGKATASVTLGNLTPTYDGNAHAATATTSPAGLNVTFTYDGSATAPTNADSYAVVSTINDTLYQGFANGTLVIAKADQTISFTGPANQGYSPAPIALSATASSGLTVIFSVVSGPASVSGNSLTLTGAGSVTVRASQSGDANRNAAPDVDQSFTATPNFNSWAQSKFTAAELLDPTISGPSAVYGQDGLPNLVKYALGLEPKQNIATGLPTVSNNGTNWIYTYTRPDSTTISDVTYAVEYSTDLVNWTSAGVTHTLVSNSGGIDTWQGTFPVASAANVFFRLAVTQP